MLARTLACLTLVAALAGCRGQSSREPPIVPIRNMHAQPRYNAQSASRYFEDGRSMRPPVEGTIPQEAELDEAIDTGLQDDGSYVMLIPNIVIDEAERAYAIPGDSESTAMERLVRRGQDRYGIYCVPCHGGLGDGQGMVPNVSNVAAMRPPTFHDDRIRHMPDGQLYATIRNGIRNMPAYRAQIPVRDRWAIVAYVRALQVSQGDQRTAMREPTP